jgi:thymidylate synthase ThyX
MRRSGELHKKISEELEKPVANYFLTNAHMREVVFKTNLRELYHFVRLRSDHHAHDEIRSISDRIVMAMKEHFPLVTAMLCGKDSLNDGKERIHKCSNEGSD